jgi:hypothetical protein
MALHERTFERNAARPFAAVLLSAVGRYREDRDRRVVEDAASKLTIERVVWIET